MYLLFARLYESAAMAIAITPMSAFASAWLKCSMLMDQVDTLHAEIILI